MKHELISIIVLAYNVESYIEQCLKSIMEQTYTNLEIIVILDGCTDKTKTIVTKYSKKDERIHIITHPNMGTCFCRIEGYQQATGKYIMYVDGDDYIEPNMVEIMYQNLSEYKVDLVHCQYKILKDQELEVPKNILNRNVKMNIEELEPQFFDLLYHTNNCDSICRELIRKKIMSGIKNVDADLLYNEDLACNLAIYKQMKSILFIPNELYIYRKNNLGITEAMNISMLYRKIRNMYEVHYHLYEDVIHFDVKDKKRYKQFACIKMFHQLTMLLYQLRKYSKYGRKEFISHTEAICHQKEVKELLQYFKKYPNQVALKEMGLTTDLTTNYLLKENYQFLYFYNKYLYSFLQFIEHKFQKWTYAFSLFMERKSHK